MEQTPHAPTSPSSPTINPAASTSPESVVAKGASAKQAETKTPFIKTGKFKIAVVVGIAVAALLGHWIHEMFTTESTDDSFVVGHVHMISARVQGSVGQVLVQDNQKVKKGDTLATLDAREYEAQVKQAQARYSKAHKDLGRMSGNAGFLPDERPILDQYQADALSTEGALQEATLKFEWTKIIAPEDGTIGKKSVETGQLVQPGQALMALVEPVPWVVANFKEGQVSNIRVGQKVEISVDAIPGHEFEGKVESVAPGSGSTFSLLPPDNATGNFTKVVQRIPVKITLEPESLKGFEDRLIPGMSTEVKIRVR